MKHIWVPLLFALGLTFFAVASPADMQDDGIASPPLVGTVAETMDGGRYTYMRVTAAGASHWVAAVHMDVAVGDVVTVRGGTPMKNFTSPTFKRTFDEILFAEEVMVGTDSKAASMKLPPGHPPISGQADMGEMPSPESAEPIVTGEIIETMDASTYTYVRVRGSDRTVWAATEKFDAKVGERVTVPHGLLMKNFQSPTLGRTFDEIYFVDSITKEDAP